uniref:Isochorismatase domain-containing protein 1 n=1 Tax=Lygus hesperus TaxID=30085 RepID=A0A0A9WF16_LYGHE
MHTSGNPTRANVAKVPPPMSEHNTVLVVCDMQETFRKHIHEFARVVGATRLLINAAKVLHIPIILTEQQPFKPIIDEIEAVLTDVPNVVRLHKTRFSVVDGTVKDFVSGRGIEHVVITGVESHICIQQSTLDFLRLGLFVNLPLDGISSQSHQDVINTVNRLVPYGVNVSSALSILYEMLQDAKHPKFKEILALYKECRAENKL